MLIVDPTRKYINSQNGGGVEVCTILSVMQILGVGNNQNIISAVTGKIIRVMGLLLVSTLSAAPPGVVFKNGSGGSTLYGFTIGDYVSPHIQPIVDCGYFECSTATALVADITAAGANIFVNYIVYTG